MAAKSSASGPPSETPYTAARRIPSASILEGANRDAVGEAGTTFVEEDEASKAREPLQVGRIERVPPHVLEVTDPSRHQDQVEWTGAEHLKGDVDAVASGVHGGRVAGSLRRRCRG